MPARQPIPPIAWMISAATAVSLAALDAQLLRDHGLQWFFREGDPVFYRAVARAPFGDGRTISVFAAVGEAPYRYGRIGMPFAAWLLGFGRPGAVGWTLVLLHQLALVAIPLLAATLLVTYGAPAIGGALAFAAPGLLVIYDRPYVEPFLIALLLLVAIGVERGDTRSAWCVLAFAILTKETAAFALLPLLWRAARRRSGREAAMWASAAVPYAMWACWVRVRVGSFPFLAVTPARRGALAFPGVGIHDVLAARTPDHVVIVGMVLATIAIALVAAWLARQFVVAGFAVAFAGLAACFGPAALTYEGEVLRLLAVPQVFAVVCLVVAWSAANRSKTTAEKLALSAPNADL